MERLRIALGPRSYDILIADGLLDQSEEHLAPIARGQRLIVVSDEQVWAAQGERLSAGLGAVQALPLVVPPGEASKSWDMLSHVVDRLLEIGVERTDHIIAFGGGVVGDLAGFASAIVNRGCNFVQIPTSLLAQVDSSVGGKTGINVAAGKNLVGAFHQPSLVLVDPSCLETLDDRQLRSGYAEIVKYALIEDAAFFQWLEENGTDVLAGAVEARRHAIAKSIAGKARIVEEDERETKGRRALLNLGHTFGHALEAETGYSDRILHGEAVAVGLCLALDFSVERGLCPSVDAERVRRHLEAVRLPVRLEQIGLEGAGAALVDHMKLDKKRQDGRLSFVLAEGIGKAILDKSVRLEDVASFLDRHP